MTKILGIDFSLTSPAYTILEGNQVTSYCLSSVKQPIEITVNNFNIYIYPIKKYFTSTFDRMEYLSNFTVDIAKNCDITALEDYSYGSKGLVFSIAEITGFVKYNLWKINKNPRLLAPAVIKRWATGKGNANKEKMKESFIEKTGIELDNLCQLNKLKTLGSPISDIVDSFYIADYTQNLNSQTLDTLNGTR